MPKITNTFIEGMDKDTSPTNYKNTRYYDARNFSIVVAEDLSSATLTNTKGVLPKLVYTGAQDRKIVGLTDIDNNLVLFIQNGDNSGEIHKIPFADLEAVVGAPIDLNSDSSYLLVTKNFNFGDRLEIVGREETSNIQKVYWVDGVNPLRFCNLLDATLSSYTIDQFEIAQDVIFTTPTYSRTVSGSLSTGVYQYSYALYNQNGSQSCYSPSSQFIQVTETGLSVTDSRTFKGSDIGTTTSSGIEIRIQDSNSNYSYIRVVSLFYSSQSSTPEITIIYEGVRTNDMYITHSGTELLGTITVEDHIATPLTFVPKTISSKNNYLFVGNIQDSFINFDFDARAYRFYLNQNISKMYNFPNWSTPSNWLEINLDTGTYPDIDNYDYMLAPFNYLPWDGVEANDSYKYMANTAILGGSGPNLSYTFITTTIPFKSTSTLDLPIWYTTPTSIGVNGYCNPSNNDLVGFQHDEIYRFGIVFFNNKGQSSFVHYIGDIRFPTITEFPVINSIDSNLVNVLGIRFSDFNFSSLPSDIVSYQIVRADRTYSNGTVVDTGYIGHLRLSSNTLYFSQSDTVASTSNPALHTDVDIKNIVEYICAETNYNRNNSIAYDRLDVYTGLTSSVDKRGMGASTYDVNNGVLTTLTPSTTLLGRYSIDNSYLFTAVRDETTYNLPSDYGGYTISSRSSITSTGSRGYKGTTLVLKTSNDINPISDHTAHYALRRRLSYPYGGYTQSTVLNTVFYPCSDINSIGSSYVDVYYGDTYTTNFEYLRVLWNPETSSSDEDRYMQVVQALVESKLNLDYTVNNRWRSYDDGIYSTSGIISEELTYYGMWETSGSWEFNDPGSGEPVYFTQDFNLYNYNSVYSKTIGDKSFFMKPLNFTEETSYSTRVLRSEKKINGELLDSWTQFLPNNFIDLDNQFGELTRLINHNNILVYLQQKAVGILPIEDREVVSTSTNSSVSIGTGGILTRFDYITTNSGTSYPDSIISSPNSLYWVDASLKKICQYSSEEVKYISDILGLYSYTNSILLSSIHSLYNPKNKEILFCLNDEGDTVVYSEYLKSFLPFSDTMFTHGIFNNGYTYVFDNIVDTYYYMSSGVLGENLYGRYSTDYLDDTYYPSTLDLIINPARVQVGKFDIIEMTTEVTDGATNILNTTFTTLRVRNNYQDSGEIILTPDSNIVRRFRTWRYNDLRDYANDPTSEGRIIDNYMRLSLSFTNDGSNKLMVNDIVTTFTPLNIK